MSAEPLSSDRRAITLVVGHFPSLMCSSYVQPARQLLDHGPCGQDILAGRRCLTYLEADHEPALVLGLRQVYPSVIVNLLFGLAA
jgi:hypothetical protein